MDAEKAAKLFAILSGVFALIAAFVWWWWVIAPNIVYGISSIDGIIWLFTQNWPVVVNPLDNQLYIIYYVSNLILIVGAIIILIGGLKVNNKIAVTGLIIIIIAAIFNIIFLYEYFVITEFSFVYFFFNLIDGAFFGLGPGFYLGIASIILGICSVIAIKKSQ